MKLETSTKGEIAEDVLATFYTCEVPETVRLGRALRRWNDSFLGYFTTNLSSHGGVIEHQRSLAHSYRN